VANVLPLQRRPAVMGINVGIGQLGLALGPIIGGAFTTNASWRWVFYLNLLCAPLVIGGMFLNNIPEAHQKPPPREVLGTALKALDLPGFALVSPAVIMLLLALEYGGNQYAWNSSVVIGLLVGAFATACVFVLWERRQGEGAMIPLAMVSKPVIRSAALTQFFKLAVILIADYYLAIFFQAIRDDSPLMSGVHMLPASFGIVVATMVTGQMTQTTGYWLPWIIAGSVLAAAGYGALTTLDPTTPAPKWIGYQVLYGLGAGGGSSSVSPPLDFSRLFVF
jgi:MFS family permease